MRKRNKEELSDDDSKVKMGSANMFLLLLGLILVAIGVILYFTDKSAVGISQPTRYSRGGQVTALPWQYVIGMGLFFIAFPVVDIIRQFRSRS